MSLESLQTTVGINSQDTHKSQLPQQALSHNKIVTAAEARVIYAKLPVSTVYRVFSKLGKQICC